MQKSKGGAEEGVQVVEGRGVAVLEPHEESLLDHAVLLRAVLRCGGKLTFKSC